MRRFKLACHLIQFGGEQRDNPEKVYREVAEAGWDGLEGGGGQTPEALVESALLARKYGLHLVNAGGPDPIEKAKYNITLGNDASEVPSCRRSEYGGAEPSDADFERAARSLDEPLDFCVKYGIKGFHHAHLGTMIETVDDAIRLMTAAPNLYLLYDTGHMLAAGSDPLTVFNSDLLKSRIGHVHLKDCHANDPAMWTHRTGKFGEQARFAELGAGNMGFDVKAALKGLEAVGYDGWVSVELDRPYPVKPAAEAAKSNREHLASLGY
ncbi:MAG: sugar phosphate isomerase/epimerase [Candidatus Poribacteria bacterium]|nr:sugar phosphate isomerase/epimerase [Candidatus Poribacteria bacterium]